MDVHILINALHIWRHALDIERVKYVQAVRYLEFMRSENSFWLYEAKIIFVIGRKNHVSEFVSGIA